MFDWQKFSQTVRSVSLILLHRTNNVVYGWTHYRESRRNFVNYLLQESLYLRFPIGPPCTNYTTVLTRKTRLPLNLWSFWKVSKHKSSSREGRRVLHWRRGFSVGTSVDRSLRVVNLSELFSLYKAQLMELHRRICRRITFTSVVPTKDIHTKWLIFSFKQNCSPLMRVIPFFPLECIFLLMHFIHVFPLFTQANASHEVLDMV